MNMYEYINGIYKWRDCQHCGDEWEYQCYECEKAESAENGVGEWEIEPTHETFDTYAEAEEHLRKIEDEMSLVNIVNELHKMLERRK